MLLPPDRSYLPLRRLYERQTAGLPASFLLAIRARRFGAEPVGDPIDFDSEAGEPRSETGGVVRKADR